MAGTTTFDDIPESLLVHILSFLPTLDAVRSSLISPKWRNLWPHIPVLNFDMRLYQSLSDSRLFFATFINHTKYDFHFSDLRNGRVEILKLVSWPKSLPGYSFSSLRSISLVLVSVNGDELFAMVSSCGNLEVLSLRCLFLTPQECVNVQSKKLLELEIGIMDKESFRIFAPKLRTLTFDAFTFKKCCFEDLSSITEACVLDYSCSDPMVWCSIVSCLSACERLTLENMCLDENSWYQGLSKCFAFKNLKLLELKTGYTGRDLVRMASFLELCPVLEELVLDYYSYMCDDILSEKCKRESVTFHMPRLRQVKMVNYLGTMQELHCVELLKLHQVVLEKILVFSQNGDGKSSCPHVLYTI